MCEQTEINYLDGDIVWVKLGACWWPGEVTSVQNLPEDIQVEFRKKPLIAAVKFFQEDTYEFVKNLHQIYKYNCTQKDEFIKKGLDKYRTKSKDGSSYMDKFPGDVEMAEKLTGGDPDILTSDKFSPEEKPDISALFGEKKIPKRKRDSTEMHRRSEGGVVARKITHPRFLRESDHEIRIRQQPSSLPSTPKTPSSDSPQFSCHLCNFTSSRVNVIICHTKSHRTGSFESPISRPRISTNSQAKSANRTSTGETQKRKYVKKTKSPTSKSKNEKKSEPLKRKYTKQIEKTTPIMKKKKTDPELREKLLADWDDESDEDMDLDLTKTIDSSIDSSVNKSIESSINISNNSDDKMVEDDEADDGNEILKASEKLLRDTEKFTSLLSDDSPSRASRNSNNKQSDDLDSEDTSINKDDKSTTPKKFKKIISPEDGKTATAEKDDKQSRFSCFDFDEEDLPEPTITPVRKIPRIFGEKNTSVKKEILKKFTLSQAMKNEKEEETEKTQQNFSRKKDDEERKEKKVEDKKEKKVEEKKDKKIEDKKDTKIEEKMEKKSEDKEEKKLEDDKETKFEENKETKENKVEEDKERKIEIFEKESSPESKIVDKETKNSGIENEDAEEEITKPEVSTCNENLEENLKSNATETVEIVEIFEVEGEKDGQDESDESSLKPEKEELQLDAIPSMEKINEIIERPMETETSIPKEDFPEEMDVIPPEKTSENQPEVEKNVVKTTEKDISEKDEVMSELATTETEDETVSEIAESLQENSENSDTDFTQKSWDNNAKTKVKSPEKPKEIVEKVAPRRRGRPRKSINVTEPSGNGDDSSKIEAVTKIKDSPASRHSERKTSESDSDRSYTGRRRKPNKRYLHSEIYARSPDNRASKTDESQSETEEKVQKEVKGRSRRGRKSAAAIETRAENIEQSKDHEFEFSSPSVEQPQVQDEEASVSKNSDNEQKEVQDKKFDVTETVSESNTSNFLDIGKKLETIGSPVNITKFLSGDAEIVSKQEEEETKEKSIGSNEKMMKISSASEETENATEEPKNITKFDKLPPKKSQIKKFELSQIDLLEACSVQVAAESAAEKSMELSSGAEMEIGTIEPSTEISMENLPEKETKIEDPETIPPIVLEKNDATSEIKSVDNAAEELVKNSTIETVEAELARLTSEEIDQRQKIEEIPMPAENESKEPEIEVKNEPKPAEPEAQSIETLDLPKESAETIRKNIFPVEKSTKEVKQIHDEEVPPNSFQEAFLKTLQVDKDEDEKKVSNISTEKPKKSEISQENVSIDEKIVGINVEPISEKSPIVPTLNAMTEFEGVEILVQENIEIAPKLDTSNASQMDLASSLSGAEAKLEDSNTLSLDLQKIQDTLTDAISAPSPTLDVCVPVKKREKPRIIENVTLKEPMQILKSKLMEKLPSKTTKHKLESETPKRSEKGGPRAKMMKIDSQSPKKSPTKGHFSVSRKLQALKAEESNLAAEKVQEKGQLPVSQTISRPADGEKFIQQSSQSLADMELDINSMPIVLSEDVHTPESIEQMPVVISSIIPSSSSSPSTIVAQSASSSTSSNVATSLTLTPTSQLVAPNQIQTVTAETPPSGKKKSGTPAILKSKGKAKPTITSIKTLVPPLTGGVKGIKFQSPQSGKAMPLISQKSTPGKYVIVQTGGQQMRYSVQGKPGISQKVAIPAGKSAGNAQVVQQGGKVVILTSSQSGQTKMLPLNISKTLSSKVQKIVNNKGQIYTPISPQGLMGTKTMIAPKGDGGSATTSKLAPGTKIISAQGMISKGGLLTPISSSQSGLIGTLSQGIITKGGLYTPISSAQLAGKTIISGKTIVNKAGRIFTSIGSQVSGTSKAVLAPISHTMTGKTIINAQGIVTPKGTILTPITGQQVKALAAKSPAKGGKIHYQSVQQKLQLPMLQKCQKIPISSSSQTKVSAGVKSPSASGTIVFQNAIIPGQKVTTPSGKKIVRQVVGVRSPQTAVTQSSAASPQQVLHQKITKTGTTTTQTMQRVVVPRGRQTKAQQKIVVQKLQESTATGSSPLMNIQGKSSPNVVGNVVKTPQKSSAAHRNAGKANRNPQQQQQQKHLLNVALTSNETSTPPMRQSQVQPPPLAPLISTELSATEHEGTTTKIDKNVDNIAKDNYKLDTPRELANESQKIEDKVAAQPQIMALPTESSDGTQTYVLVTIDEQGQIQPLDNNTLMSLEGTTQNSDGTRTLYIDPSSLGEAGALDNIVLQFDNGALPNLQSSSNVVESSQTAVSSESFSSSEIIQTSNQDILAAALANTDFQQEIGLPENTVSSVMPSLTQTSLINQTILQSTIIPPTEPISSPSVLETSLTLNQPIMTPLEVPSSLPIQVEANLPSVVSTIPTSLELPITITNPNISYIASSAGGETHIQIPGNSMPDIGEIMENPTNPEISQEIPASTQYLVIPSLDENLTIQAQAIATGSDSASGSVSYSVSIPENAVIESSQVQTTPSMPIIDDSFAEPTEQNFQTSGSDISATKSIEEGKVEEMPPIETSSTSIETETTENTQKIDKETPETEESLVAQETPEKIELPVGESPIIENITNTEEIPVECNAEKDSSEKMEVDSQPIVEEIAISGPTIDETISTEMQVEVQSSENLQMEATHSQEIPGTSQTSQVQEKSLESSTSDEMKPEVATLEASNIEASTANSAVQESSVQAEMVIEQSPEMDIYPVDNSTQPEVAQSVEASSQAEAAAEPAVSENIERMEETNAENSQEEAPSQSYEQFNTSSNVPSESIDSPTQSAGKSENSREPSQSIVYDPMEIDENIVTGEPPTQSFDDSKQNEASQSYETSVEVNTNAPTQSFNEIMQCQEEGTSGGNAIDDPSFPTQSYEVGKMENLLENLESDGAVSQEGNIPSQSNDIAIDGIGTSSVSTNNLGLNEDETASSSYMPETPENQERDQDQESAISTSSYEIPPCEELNIASSSVIPDTSANSEHTSIHDNGVPEIPTSSYSLNPDSSSTSHVDTLPTSSYEDQVIVEQNVSTSYEVPISMPGLDENSSQNFVTESSDHRDEPSSYYARHPEVSASYYETVNQDSNSRLEADNPQEQVTPSYYENPQDITSEASQSYFRATPRYSSQSVSPSYYETAPESEASQSYYSHEIEATEQSSRNVEASQSFYQETNDEIRLRQQGEATPTYTERYPVDYALANSPIERHDLVESSVPATRPTER